MADPTNAELLSAYKSALLAVSNGQSYTINGRSLTRTNLKEIRETVEWLEARVDAETEDDDATGNGIALARF